MAAPRAAAAADRRRLLKPKIFGCLRADGQKIRLVTVRDDDITSQSCSQTAALARSRFRALVGRAAASGARPEALLEGAREVFVARRAAAAF